MIGADDHEVWQKTRELYDDHRFGDFCYGQQRDQHNRPLIEFLRALPEEGDVYDIGCGTGYWVEAAARLGVVPERLVGVDIVPGNVVALRAKGFKGLCGDVLALALKDDAVDVTICSGVIHCTPDPRSAFRELVRITKPGGLIFLAVYNRWNPYFYLVHRAGAPIRYLYWHRSKRVLDWVYPVAGLVFQPLAYALIGRFLDRSTGKTMFADQVITPYAHLFAKRTIRQYARQCGCAVLDFGYSGGYLMITAVLRVAKTRPAP